MWRERSQKVTELVIRNFSGEPIGGVTYKEAWVYAEFARHEEQLGVDAETMNLVKRLDYSCATSNPGSSCIRD